MKYTINKEGDYIVNIDKIVDFIGNQGLAITVSAILLLLLWHFGRETLDQYKKQKDLDRENLKADKQQEREERKEDRAIQRQQMESLIEISSRSTQALEEFRRTLEDSDRLITMHDASASQKFENIDCRFDSVDNQLDALKSQVEDLAPKVMVDEVKESIEGIRNYLKKD